MKKTRSRLKSATSESQVVDEEQMANSNGGKSDAGEAAQESSEPEVQIDKVDEGNEDESVASEDTSTPMDEVIVEKIPHGRKRKASEMKATESDNEESQVAEKLVIKTELDSESVESSESKSNEKDDSRSEDVSAEGILDTSGDISTMKQLLGKGKRARIPNKRYSDFPLKATRGSSEPMDVDFSKENGEKENVERESGSNSDLNKGDVSEHTSSTYSSPNVAVSAIKGSRLSQVNSPSTPAKKQKLAVDLTNPIYLKPFKYGWKRELVYRTTNDNNNKRNGDIYYYTPTGKKVRSMREVSENLKNKELSLEDFTFFKEPLGLDDPEKEIIRDAKIKSGTSTPASKKSTPKPIKKVATPAVASPKVVAPPPPPPELVEDTKPKSSPRLSAFKIKLGTRTSAKGKQTNKKKEKEDADLEIGNWTAPKKASKSGNKSTVSPKKTRRSTAAAAGTISSIANRATKEEEVNMDNYLQSVAFGYSTLLHVFQYLKVQDLLRAGCVCSMWRDMASHSSLWKTVRMKNSQIHSFKGLANALESHGTIHLDLRKMLLPSNSNDEIWQEFTSEIKKVDSLKKIELCRCPAVVVEQLAMSNPKLEVVNAVTIKCESMNMAPISYLPNLQELRLKSTSGFALTSNLTALSELKHLKHLSLTSIRDLNELKISVIADLQNLESLDLGECVDFPRTFGSEILSKLDKLEKLRLEKGQGNCYTFEILEAVKNMKRLEQLELVNFDIKTGFDRALGACINIKKLLIIPTYISQSATTNHMVLGGVLRLQATLSHFVWGVTLELLRVTELFVDQCEDPEKKEKKEKKPISNGDSIPVLKPVPLLRDGSNVEIPPAQDPPQVEILPLPNLQKLLLQSLPTTRVKILKIPFHATWRQSITDTVN